MIYGVDLVTFDAIPSLGEGLTYRIDYWDNTYSESVRSERVVTRFGRVPVRLTVTDRFGRVSSDADDFLVVNVTNAFDQYGFYWECFSTAVPRLGAMIFHFFTEGPSLSGSFNYAGASPPRESTFTGSVTPARRIHLDASDGTSFDGSATTSYDFGFRLRLIDHGSIPADRSLECDLHVT